VQYDNQIAKMFLCSPEIVTPIRETVRFIDYKSTDQSFVVQIAENRFHLIRVTQLFWCHVKKFDAIMRCCFPQLTNNIRLFPVIVLIRTQKDGFDTLLQE
jgi:hypothetical protein